MRLLIISESFPPFVSGAAVQAGRIADYAYQSGHEVTVLSASPTGEYQISTKPYKVIKAPSWSNPLRKQSRYSSPFSGFLVESVLRSGQFDLIDCHDIAALSFTAACLASRYKAPVVYHHHFSDEFIRQSFSFRPLGEAALKLVRCRTRSFAKKCALIITPSFYSKGLLVDWGINGNMVKVISNGVDTSRFLPVDDPLPVRKELRLLLIKRKIIDASNPIFSIEEVGRRHILFIGRMDRDKNIKVLLEASRTYQYGSDGKDLPIFLFVGGGNFESEFERYVKHHNLQDRVRKLPFIAHKEIFFPMLYQASDAYWTASNIETESITTLEAMACGLPIVAARAGALAEIVEQGRTGLLVDSQVAIEFSAAMTVALKKRETMSHEAVSAARTYDLQYSLEKVMTAFREVRLCCA